eukprot:gene35556-46108_t
MDNWAEMKFSDADRTALEGCSAVLINFGQWQVSYATRMPPYFKLGKLWKTPGGVVRGPYSVAEYGDLVSKTLHAYLQMLPPSSAVYFLGTMPIGNQDFTCGVITEASKYPDYRNDAALRALNEEGMHVCRSIDRLHCMNLFEVGNIFKDLSYDGAHFKAPVASQMALAVLTVLLNDEADRASITR